MKRVVLAIALLCVLTATAGATGLWTLNRVGSSLHGFSGNYTVSYDSFINRGVGGAGFFTVDIWAPGSVSPDYQQQLICLDVGNYIYGGDWSATRYYVPPDPPYPPPFSTRDAVELFYEYEHQGLNGTDGWRGTTLESKQTAAALQFALWEITHTPVVVDGDGKVTFDWRVANSNESGWIDGHWHLNGDFQLTNNHGWGAKAITDADAMLKTLYPSGQYSSNSRGYYYRPDGNDGFTSQGLLGEAPPIPEPSTLILLGLGLTAAGVGVIRRRRKA